MAALKKRLRPRFAVLRLRGFSLILGIRPALKIHFRLVRGIKTTIKIEISTSEGQPDLFRHLLQRLQALWQQHHVGLIHGSHWDRSSHSAIVVDDRDDFLAFLVFIARVGNPIAPFLATVLVPSPWSTLRSSCFSAARCRTLATNACQSDPSSAHFAKTFAQFIAVCRR